MWRGPPSPPPPLLPRSWQCLTYLPIAGALLYDEGRPSNGHVSRKLQVGGVPVARWEALARCATMRAWWAAVDKLLLEATQEGRVVEL